MPRYVYTRHLQIFAKFLLLFTCCFVLSKSPSICFLWCSLVPVHVYGSCAPKASGSVALWDLFGLFLSVPVLICLPSGLWHCVLLDLPVWFWFPGPYGGSPTGMFNEFWWTRFVFLAFFIPFICLLSVQPSCHWHLALQVVSWWLGLWDSLQVTG